MHWMLTSKPAVLFLLYRHMLAWLLLVLPLPVQLLRCFIGSQNMQQKLQKQLKSLLLLEDETNLRKIAVVLAKAQTLLKDAKFNRADRNKLVKFINENRATLEDLAARIEEAQHQE